MSMWIMIYHLKDAYLNFLLFKNNHDLSYVNFPKGVLIINVMNSLKQSLLVNIDCLNYHNPVVNYLKFSIKL